MLAVELCSRRTAEPTSPTSRPRRSQVYLQLQLRWGGSRWIAEHGSRVDPARRGGVLLQDIILYDPRLHRFAIGLPAVRRGAGCRQVQGEQPRRLH
jgi:hypothetical protein